jgi:hypothetical protein
MYAVPRCERHPVITYRPTDTYVGSVMSEDAEVPGRGGVAEAGGATHHVHQLVSLVKIDPLI